MKVSVERDAARESMYALDELTDKQSDLINTQIKQVAELTESLDNYRAMLLDSDAELAAAKAEQQPVQGIPYALRNAVEYLDKSELNSIFSGSILHREMKDAIDFPEYAAPQPSDDVKDALVDALEDILSGWIYIRQQHGDLYGVGWGRAQGKAEKALAAYRAAMGSKGDESIN